MTASALLLPRSLLHPLPDTANIDMHFVADDYSGSGNFTDRKGGFVGVLNGTVTRQACSQFPGRYELTGFSTSNYFLTATAAAHNLFNTPNVTYEFLVKVGSVNDATICIYAATTSKAGFVFGKEVAGISGRLGYLHDESFVVAVQAASSSVNSKYALVTMTMDQTGHAYKLYFNGVEVATSAIDGVLTSGNAGFSIGRNASGAFSVDSGFTLLEIVRHTATLDAATVAARAAQMNLLKGY